MTTAHLPTTSTELLEAVERLRPLLEANRDRHEADRCVSREVYDAMADAGLFAMVAPRAHGGLELPLVEVLEVWEAVGRIDPAAVWNLLMNSTVAAGFAALLPDDSAAELYRGGPATLAGALFPPGAAVRVEGGWRVTGRTPFASGCHNAAWVGVPVVELVDGEPRLDPVTGMPAPFVCVVRREQVEIVENWDTLGMRGTGSHDVAVTDLFVPEAMTLTPGVPGARRATGFDGPLSLVFPLSAMLGEAVVSVAVAASALEDLLVLAATKTAAYNTVPLREQQLAQHGAGKAYGRVHAARDTLHAAARAAYDEASATGEPVSWAAKVRVQAAVSFAAEACAEAVRLVADVAGSTSFRRGEPFERHFRDVHTLLQHASKANPRYASAGRLLFGLENDWAFLAL